MAKNKQNRAEKNMNATSAQGQDAGFNQEFSTELSEPQKQNNKKRKKNQ